VVRKLASKTGIFNIITLENFKHTKCIFSQVYPKNSTSACLNWYLRLGKNTSNRNDAELLKVPTDRTIYTRRRSLYPFDLSCFEFEKDGKVKIANDWFTIANTEYTDLFSVLAYECLQNEASAHETEIVLLKHRYSYFEDLNYKLVTQPWSHNFTIDAIKYCGFPCKGNIKIY